MLRVPHRSPVKIAKLHHLHRQRLFVIKEGGISCSVSVSSARYIAIVLTSIHVANIILCREDLPVFMKLKITVMFATHVK